jgi:predicted transcriptional regulator
LPDNEAAPPVRERLVVEIPADVKQSLRIAAARANRDQWQIVADAVTEYVQRHDL